MADTAYERYLKDTEQTDNRKGLDQVKDAFFTAVQNLGEPKPPVKYLKPLFPDKDEEGKFKDTSAIRAALFLNPNLRITTSQAISQKLGKPTDIIKYLESQDDKDYISGLDEFRKGIDSGTYDLVSGVGTLLFSGTDLAFNTDFQTKFEEIMKDKEPSRPETWQGDVVGLMTQFAVPGTVVQSIVNRIPKVAKVKKAIETIKGSKKRKVSKIASRAVEGATVVGATDFIASEPGRESFFFEPESTEGLTGKKKAAATLRNKIKYGQEGTLVGGGFPIVGKGMQLMYKYGLKPPVRVTASVGAKAIDNAVFKPIIYLGSTRVAKPIVSNASKAITGTSKFVLSTAAKGYVSARSGRLVKQLPPFEEWRLFSTASPVKEERAIKSLDNILSYLRSYGKIPKDIEGISESAMLYIKARARRIDRTMEGLERKSYALAKQFEKNYNKGDSSPALQKYYLDQIEEFLRGQRKLSDLPTELQPLSSDLKLQVKNTMAEFKKLLPKSKKADEYLKDLESIEINRVGSYLVKSFSTFTNPGYLPDKQIMSKAVDYLVKNVITKNKSMREDAIRSYPNLSISEAYEQSAENLAEAILRAGRSDGKNPVDQLKKIGTELLKNKKFKFLKTGEELPVAIKQLLGEEKNLKTSVATTISEIISASANKRAFDAIARSGIKNGWLFKTKDAAIFSPRKYVDAQQITSVPRLGNVLKSDVLNLYASPEYVQAFKGVGSTLDNLLTIPVYREIMQGKIAIQIGKTLYSPQTQVRNVSSASFFALMNGHIGGKASVTNAMKIVLDDIFKAGKGGVDEVQLNKYVEKLIRLGVFDENVVASELKAVMDQIKNNTIRTSDQLFSKLIKMTPTDKVARLYAGGDNLWKHYGYEYYRSQLSQALKNLDDIKEWFKYMGRPFDEIGLTGNIKTFDDGLDEAAAYLLRNTYPTYSKVPPSIQNLRKLPVGAFISFPAEILRTGANIMMIGLKEAAHPNAAIRQMGLRRLLGAFITSSAAGKGFAEISQFVTGSDQAQWEAYKRSAAAQWDSRSNLLAIEGWKDGESAAINFSYFQPYDSLFAPFEAALKQANDQKLNPQETEKFVLDLMFADDGPVMTFLEPYITEPIGFDRFIDVTTRNGRKDQGGTVYTQSDDLGDKFIKSFLYILDGVKPGVITSSEKIAGALGKDLTKGGKPLNLKDELLALFAGTRIIRIDVKKDLRFKAAELNRLLRAVDENEQFYNVNNYQNNTPDKLIKTYEDMQQEAFRLQKDMFITIEDLKLLDLSNIKIDEILKKAGVSSKLRSNLKQGLFTPINYSKKRFDTKVKTIQNELRKMGDENVNFFLNRSFVYPELALDGVKRKYFNKRFFTEKYDPKEKFYLLDKDGQLIFDENGNPKLQESFFKRQLKKVPPFIKYGLDQVLSPLSLSKAPLNAPEVNKNLLAQAPVVNQNTGLTETQTALLSPEEQVIARRT